MYQNSANPSAVLFGSATIAIPSSSGGYVDIGAAKGIKITESFDSMQVEIDNCPTLLIGAKNQKITVEGTMLEVNWQVLARMRGGLDTFSTTTFTFDSGGNVTITPQELYVVHQVSSSAKLAATIYYAGVTEGMTLPFPSDAGTTVAEVPFKLVGTCMSSRTNGAQLYNIVDTRPNIYTSTSHPYVSTTDPRTVSTGPAST
jgi:hypothetical protein